MKTCMELVPMSFVAQNTLGCGAQLEDEESSTDGWKNDQFQRSTRIKRELQEASQPREPGGREGIFPEDPPNPTPCETPRGWDGSFDLHGDWNLL